MGNLTSATAAISGLTPNSTYHYRVVAINLAGTTVGPDHTFTTAAAPAIAATRFSSLTSTSVELDAEINPHFVPTTVHFDYGPTDTYGQSTNESSTIGSGRCRAQGVHGNIRPATRQRLPFSRGCG